MITARWHDWFGKTVEDLVLTEGAEIISADSVIKDKDGNVLCQYKITCGQNWVFKDIQIQMTDGKKLYLRSDGAGNWFSGPYETLQELHGAIDVDFAATPFTNTLPVKRLDMERGETHELDVAWISFPDLEIKMERQRYACIVPRKTFRFEMPDTDFTRDIEFADDGLVQNYPDLFRREG